MNEPQRKYKIFETMSGFRIHVLVPNLKSKTNRFGFPTRCYYDHNDMIWVPVNHWGHPIYPSRFDSIGPCSVSFDTLEQAKEFIERIRRPKLEIII